MPFGDLFKNKREREQEESKRRRKAFREAESAADTVKDKIKTLKADRDKAWNEAREHLKSGKKAAAQRCLQTVRATEVMMGKLEQKHWVFQQLTSKLEMARNDQEFAQALSAINVVVNIDPEAVADVLDEVQDKLGEQVDVDKIWDKVHGKEMEGVENQMTDSIPSLEEMEADLEDEVAAEMDSATSRKRSRTTRDSEPSLSDKIGEGRSRLRSLLGEEGEK